MENLICHKVINNSDFFFNQRIIKHLDNIIKCVKSSNDYKEIPNMLLIGYNGSGKQTLIKYFIFNLFDCHDINNNDIFNYDLMTIETKKTTYYLKYTNYFLMIDNINVANDKTTLQDIIKKYVSQHTIDNQIKFIIINDINKLSYFSQMSLRRTMEIYNNECKFILIGESNENILKPLISRCINFRLHKPLNDELNKLLNYLIIKNNIELSKEQKDLIINKSNNNISEFFAILNKIVCSDIFKISNIKDKLYDEIFDIINEENDIEILSFIFIRDKILELIKYGEDVDLIIKKINDNLYSRISDKDKLEKLNILNKKLDMKCTKSEQDYIYINVYLSELLFILTK